MKAGWNRRSCSFVHVARFLALVLVLGSLSGSPALGFATRLRSKTGGDAEAKAKAESVERARKLTPGTINYGKLAGTPCSLTNGPGDGSVSVTLDPLGSYGTAQIFTANTTAYDPVGPDAPATTVFDTAVYFSPLDDYLTTVGLSGPATNVTPTIVSCTPTQMITSWTLLGYTFLLTQTLGPASADGSVLTQEYAITNNNALAQSFKTVRYLDGDLAFDGSIADGGKVGSDAFGTVLSEFDAVGDNSVKSVVSIRSGPTDGAESGFSMQPWNGHQFANAIQTSNGIPPELRGQVAGDTNGDLVTDTNYDVTLGLEHTFNVAPGQTVLYTTITEWADKAVFTADISVDVTDSPDPVASNDDFLTYRIEVDNPGPEIAYQVRVTGTLDPNAIFITSSGGTCTPPNPNTGGGTVVCDIGSIPIGGTGVLLITVIATSAPGTMIGFTAEAESTLSFDPNTADNEDSTTTSVVAPMPDVGITKSASSEPVAQDSVLVYTIVVENFGPGTARGVVVNESTPAGTAFVALSSSQGTCTTLPYGATGSVTCNLGTIRRGETASIFFSVRVDAAAGSTITNTSTVTTNPNLDPNPANNTSNTVVSTVSVGAGRANLGISKTATPDPVAVGEELTYTITVGNAGPDTANNVTVFDSNPPGTQLWTGSTTTGSIDTPPGGVGRITVNLGQVAPGGGGVITLVFKVLPSAPPILTSTATVVSAASGDPVPSNNSATTEVHVAGSTGNDRQADLSVTQAFGSATFGTGTMGRVTITVTNLGPWDAENVRLNGSTPDGTTFGALEVSQGTFVTPSAGSAGAITAQLGTIELGRTATLTLDLKMTSPPGSRVTNRVSVASGLADPNGANNAAQATAEVVSLGPTVDRVQAQAGPFRVKIVGSGFDPGSRVYIGDSSKPWENAIIRNSRTIVLKRGAELAALFPRGVEVTIRVVNSDGTSATVTFRR